MSQSPTHILTSISDNGIGISKHDQKKSNCFGLIGIKERLYAFNGNLEIKKQRKGSVFSIKIPLEAPHD